MLCFDEKEELLKIMKEINRQLKNLRLQKGTITKDMDQLTSFLIFPMKYLNGN